MSRSKTLTINGELKALQRLLVVTRSLAENGAEPTRIARILDETEYLLTLILHNESEEEFRLFLQHIGQKFPEFAGIEHCFDEAKNVPADTNTGLPPLEEPAAIG